MSASQLLHETNTQYKNKYKNTYSSKQNQKKNNDNDASHNGYETMVTRVKAILTSIDPKTQFRS